MGEHLPFALEAAGIATGKTTSELYKMMDQGKLLSKDFLIPFGEAMSVVVRRNNALAKATEKLTSQQARMGNAFKIMIDDMFQKGGGVEFFSKLFKGIAIFVKAITPAITAISSVVFGFLGLIWDVGVAVVDVIGSVGSLIAAILKFGGAGEHMHGLLSIFYSIKAVIYDIIAGVHEMGEVLRGETKFTWDTSRVMDDSFWKKGAPQSTPPAGTTIQGGIHVTSNAADARDVAAEVFQQFNIEAGLFQ